MTDRRYSVPEIDQMRGFLRVLLTPTGVSFRREEVSKNVEEQLRTYMLAGTEPDELREHMNKLLREQQRVALNR